MDETEPTPIEDVNEDAVKAAVEADQPTNEPDPETVAEAVVAEPEAPAPVRYACGLSLVGIRRVMDGVERSFRGRPEYPFGDELRAEMEKAVLSCRTQPEAESVMRDMARATVTKRQRMTKGHA